MIQRTIIIQIQHGLQARIATEFVQKASSFDSEISLVKNGRVVDSKSIMGIMALAIREGEQIILITDGHDEQLAVGALERFLLNEKSSCKKFITRKFQK